MRSEIPRFFLYGEPPREVGERFLHLESLDDRSRPANWNIRPHTHANLNHVFHLTDGRGEMRADGETLAFEAPCLLIVPAGVVHGFSWTSDSRGDVLTLSAAYLGEVAMREPDLATVFNRPAALARPAEQLVEAAFARMRHELSWSAPGHRIAVEALLLAILVEVLRLKAYMVDDEPYRTGPQAAIVARFRALVEARYRTDLSVDDYASELKIHPKRLRAACLAIAGATPLRIIQDRRLLEAKRLLLYSNMTIAETAYYLGFEDPAYFTRFFTKACSASPRMFRGSKIDSEAEE
jgi:AraC family transcriptional activator of pobA